MSTPSSIQLLNAAQNQHIIALAASVSDSMRTGMILLILAAARLGQRDDAPKQLAGMSCKQVYEWVKHSPHECSYEAVRKLLKSLVENGLAEFCKGKYTLADSVAASLRKLADPDAKNQVTVTGAPNGAGNIVNQSGQVMPNSVATSVVATPVAVTDAANDEINTKAIEYFVDLAAFHSFRPRSSLYWQVACCHTVSIAQLAAAASGLAGVLMSKVWTSSPIDELQAILDGKSAIKPSSAASFVFAYEASMREGAAEAKSKFLAPFVNAALENFSKRFEPQQVPVTAPANAESPSVLPLPQPDEERPLATIYKLPIPGDYGSAA
jgi:hypothetical protein